MTIFLLIYTLLGVFLVYKFKHKLLCNEMFWLGMFWLLIIGVYYSSGVIVKKYSFSIELFIYLFFCIIFFVLGRNKGKTSRVRVFDKDQQSVHKWMPILLGFLGVILFVFDLIRLNGIMLFLGEGEGKNNEYEISIIGSIGAILIPLLLVEGLYLIALKFRRLNSLSLLGLLLLLLYSVPCILNNGRESLAYALVGIIALYGYGKMNKEKEKLTFKRIVLRCMIALGGILFLFLIISISSERFGKNEINVFISTHDVSSEMLKEGESWGDLEFLYYNVASYFSHQLTFLEFTFKEYDGPYMGGLFELNIISRRLPESMGLNYQSVYDNLDKLYSRHGVSFKGGWNTVLGSFIFDFGRILSVLLCYFVGYVIGKIRRKFEDAHDERYAVLIALFCAFSFSTIQLGPFYNTLIYGSFIWWMIIFMHNENKLLPKIHKGKRRLISPSIKAIVR